MQHKRRREIIEAEIPWKAKSPERIQREGLSIINEYNHAVYWLERAMITVKHRKKASSEENNVGESTTQRNNMLTELVIPWKARSPDRIYSEGLSMINEYNNAVYWLGKAMITVKELNQAKDVKKTRVNRDDSLKRSRYSNTSTIVGKTKDNVLPLPELLNLVTTAIWD
jgi:hypothetical protein